MNETAESTAYASAIYWACRDGTWCKLGDRCLRPASDKFCLLASPGRELSWRPWTQLMDTSAHPYVSWFKGAKTNVTFSCVDVPALASCDVFGGDGLAYEAVGAKDDLNIRSRESDRLTRSDLLQAVLICCCELEENLGVPLTPLARVYVHAATGLEQAIVCHSCARKAVCYTCTALDATDESLTHRFIEFTPLLVVASADTLSGPMTEMAAARCTRLFGAVPCCAIERGDARAWATSSPQYAPPIAVGDACALIVVFTSGSTGKPKGLVHGHGGYGSCVARSMAYVFNARAGSDIFLTLATFAWITGQSYMLYGPALAQCASLLIEGSPLGTDGLRWAHIAKARGATILKCASAFARYAMGDRLRLEAIEALDLPNSSLRLGTFCAEPVSADVQRWAAKNLVLPFLNSYWATEHGSIVLSRDPCGIFQPDTKCWPVPWVRASLLRTDNHALGDIILDAPYAGLARTIFGDLDTYGTPHWCGDLARFKAAYFPGPTLAGKFGFVQGDVARTSDGAFTFHGRRDEVLNILGVRVGLEELEKVAWRASNGTVQDIVIIGAPDALKGQIPVGWVVSECMNAHLITHWRKALRDAVGVHAEPSAIIAVKAFPKTITGKTQRGLLQAALRGEKALKPADAARVVCDINAYADCYAAAQHWRLSKATSLTVPLQEIASFWARMCFDCHKVGGSPLLPATGWLCLLSFALSDAPVGLHKVQLLRGVHDAHQPLVLRKRTGATAVIEDVEGFAVVKCEFHEPALSPLCNLDVEAWVDGPGALLEDLNGIRHYRRCAAVALKYSGPFKCVDRVAWRADWGFRAFVSATTAPALLDAALQVVCSLDALGRGATFIPFYVDRFEAVRNLESARPAQCLIIGELTTREDSRLECDIALYAVENTSTDTLLGVADAAFLVATLKGVKFAKVDVRQPRRRARASVMSASLQRTASKEKLDTGSLVLDTGNGDDSSLMRNIIGLGSDLVGGSVDPRKSLFENGLHSLRAIELIGKLNQAYDVTLNSAQLSAGEDSFAAVAAALRSAIDSRGAADASRQRFAHVSHEALQRIVDARLTGAEAPGIGSEHQRSALAEAARGVIYMIRRGFLKYLRIQYRDGLFHFLLSTPTIIDLERTVVIPGTRVHFEQTDYNRHFTVREIVRDSERGFYNLVHASGLAHLEHYFRVMFFASRLEARFDAELLEGESYEMRCRVAQITGPLVDAEVAFYSLRKPDTQAFVVTWRLMLVIDPRRKLMYDFERGGAFGDGDTAADRGVDMPPSPSKHPKRSETWTLTRRGKFITSGSIAFFGVLIGLYAMAPVAVRILIPLPLAVAEVLKDLKPREAILIFAMVGFWQRTHPGREPLDGPVDMLLPHG